MLELFPDNFERKEFIFAKAAFAFSLDYRVVFAWFCGLGCAAASWMPRGLDDSARILFVFWERRRMLLDVEASGRRL